MLLSVAVGLAGVIAVLALGFGLQASMLSPPEPEDRIAADASKWLLDHHYSVDVFHTDGQRLHGACLRGWYPQRPGERLLKRGSLLVLQGGTGLLATPGGGHIRYRFLSSPPRRHFPFLLAIATGCTDQLGHALYKAAQGNTRLSMERAFAADQPAIALEIPSLRGRLTVYLSPRQYRPLVAIENADGHTITARIYLARASLRLRVHYRQLLNRRTPRHSPAPS